MEMFSKELQELDRNTVQYMIDEMQDVIDAQKEDLDRQKDVIDAQKEDLSKKNNIIDGQKTLIDTQKRQIEDLKKQLAEKGWEQEGYLERVSCKYRQVTLLNIEYMCI